MGYGDPLNSSSELHGRNSIDLLARMIYGEAEGESEKGKRGCAFVAKNRKQRNSSEFGGSTWEGVLFKGFSGFTSSRALKPDINSQAWKDSLNIAQNLSSKTNPIGNCLFFNTNSLYARKTRTSNGKEQYTFNGNDYRNVTEKHVIGNHTFFLVSGY